MQVAQTEAEPFRVARDEAATRLAATLSAAANQARELARAKTNEAANQVAAADEADEQALCDTRTLEGVRRDISDIERRIHAVRTTQEKLHAEGFVHADEPPAAALTRHEAQRQRLDADHEAAEGQLDGVEKRLGEVADELAAIGEALATLKPALEAATAEHARLSGQAQRLATHDVVSDILDTAGGDLWTADVQLLEGLRERINRIERALIDTRLAAVEDERTVEGVTSDGLVPGHPDVLDTVQVLQQLGISAHPGWQYLHAHLPEERRAAAIAACPGLAAGIVVSVPSHLERAREAIASSGRTVRTLVTVGDARTLLAQLYDDGARDDSVIVPPLPGLYDDAAAAEDAERAQRSLLRAGELRAAHELELAGLRSLTGELNDFWEACPPGKLDGLRAEINALEAQDATARQRRERLTGERDQLIQRRTALTTELKRLRNAMSDADRVIPRLRAWSEAAHEAAESQQSLSELAARVTSLTADISGHRGRAAQARADADRLGGQAKTDADRGDKLAEELGQLLGVAEDFDATLAIDDIGAARVRHEVCQRRYSEQTTDSELAVALDGAETATAKALGALADFDADIQARAAELIAEHCGADRGLRRTAERQARDDADAAEAAHGNAQSAYDRTDRDAEAARPAEDRRVHAQLPPELEPEDLNAALALHARAIRDAETKLAEANSARQAASEATALAEATARDAQTLNDIAESVSQVLQTARSAFGLEALPSAELHFSGSIDVARQRRSELNRELATASEAAMRAAGEVTAHVNHVWHYARSPRFAALREGRMVARLADDSGEQIATHAAQRVTELSQRAAQIELILDEISQHRDVLIGTLTGQVKAGLRALKAASRASRMPDALGEWSGREFVRVDFTLPDSEDTLHDRLGAVLDEAADGRTDRNGVDLVLRGVHAAARPVGGGDGRTGGFRVTVLKPDTVLENVRVPVSDMSVFSGGQRLTAAIALYCTMARMRATERGRPRNSNSGVLFLDNPLGTANAEYLLHIQLGVAQALGVQLVYTTGINDLNALSKFGRVLPLRNDADLRQGLRFVHLAPELLDTLRGGRDLDDDRGYLSSSVLVAPTAAASGVGTVDVSALLEAQVAGSEGTASANGATGRASDES
jgi:DNA repair exonuclease SbcCD ATPase subunit